MDGSSYVSIAGVLIYSFYLPYGSNIVPFLESEFNISLENVESSIKGQQDFLLTIDGQIIDIFN